VGGVTVAGALVAPAANAGPRSDVVQMNLDSLVRDDGYPAALASVRDRRGHIRDYTAGLGDLTTKPGFRLTAMYASAATPRPSPP
jgi:D-alanyl-D-alanine carboxypeptidase